MQNSLRVGVIGAGHFGRYHALKIRAVARETLVGLFDPDSKRAAAVAQEAGCPVMTSVDDLLAVCDALGVAAPCQFPFAFRVPSLPSCTRWGW